MYASSQAHRQVACQELSKQHVCTGDQHKEVPFCLHVQAGSKCQEVYYGARFMANKLWS